MRAGGTDAQPSMTNATSSSRNATVSWRSTIAFPGI